MSYKERSKNAEASAKWRAANREVYLERNREASRRFNLENPGASKARSEAFRHRKEYGITSEVYYERMATSLTCEHCQVLPCSSNKLCYDHNHSTGAFRGVLCFSCNTSLGKLGDSVEAIERMLSYLKRVK